jgi:hypothetical protein
MQNKKLWSLHKHYDYRKFKYVPVPIMKVLVGFLNHKTKYTNGQYICFTLPLYAG